MGSSKHLGPLGIAVVGCGRISRSHLAAVVAEPERARLIATVDTDAALAQAAADRYGAKRALASLDETLARDDVDAVIVCLPNHLHADAAIAAMRAGKHVMVEKPMADTAAQAQAMSDAAQQLGVCLSVAQCRRHFGAIRHLAEHREDFGALISAQVSLGVYWPDAQAPWWREGDKASGLVVALNGPHVLDFVQLAMQADPVRVQAQAVRRKQYWAGEDEAMMLLTYPGDRLASVHLSFNQRPVEDRKVLVFEGGTVVIEQDRRLTFNGETLVAPGADEDRHYLDEAVEFKRQFQEFVRATRGEPNHAVTAAEGVRLIRTLDAVHQAMRSGVAVTPEYFEGPARGG